MKATRRGKWAHLADNAADTGADGSDNRPGEEIAPAARGAPLSNLAAVLAAVKEPAERNVRRPANANKDALKVARKEHVENYLDDFWQEAVRMLGKMGDVQSDLLAKNIEINDGYSQFWGISDHKTSFPRCFELFRILCSIPASSVSVESMFSFMSYVDLPRRRSLDPNRLGRIAHANAWSRRGLALLLPWVLSIMLNTIS